MRPLPEEFAFFFWHVCGLRFELKLWLNVLWTCLSSSNEKCLIFARVLHLADFRHEADNLSRVQLAAAVVLQSGSDVTAKLSWFWDSVHQWLQHPRRPSVLLQKIVHSCLQQARCVLRMCKFYTSVMFTYTTMLQNEKRAKPITNHNTKPGLLMLYRN